MEYFVISAKFVPLKYYTLSSQLRRLTSFSVGLFGSANSVTRSYPVMRKSCITHKSNIQQNSSVLNQGGNLSNRHVHERGYQYYSSIWKTYFSKSLFFGHYVGNVLLFKLNIFAEGKCVKKLSHQHQVVLKIRDMLIC